MSMSLYVGLDVGGTSMKAGVVDDAGKALASVSLPTEAHRGQEVGLERMCETIRQAVVAAGLKMSDISALGVATPGTMDIPGGVILDPPNLKPWRNVPVRDHIAKVFKLPTAFQNDANAAAFGEFWAGAGRDAHSMVLFTLGTGVGGGIIIGDLVLEGEHSHGAELGHMKIVEDTSFYLAVGAMNMMHTIDPDMVVFGGGMIAAGEMFLDRIRKFIKELAFPVPAEKTTICYAQLGSDAGFIGAAACGRKLFAEKNKKSLRGLNPQDGRTLRGRRQGANRGAKKQPMERK